MTLLILGLLDFHGTLKNIPLKHSCFRPSADVKPMPNDLVRAMPWQCMFALYMCYYNLYGLPEHYSRTYVFSLKLGSLAT
jgi:hypothetical protein